MPDDRKAAGVADAPTAMDTPVGAASGADATLLAAPDSEPGRQTPAETAAPHPREWPADRYDRRSLLGAGGMGEVHLCADRVIGRDVALKVIRPDTRESPASFARFVREAKVQARLEHPAVVPVYDLGVAEGSAWFTMKRVRGRTLDGIVAALARGDAETAAAFTRRRLLEAFVRVCMAVDYAHQHGVIHRDLKPSNIMLGDFAEVYVLDWGLARVEGVQEAPLPAADDRAWLQQTVEGSLMGTPGYMAPEQARGSLADVDARTDVYALGAILFQVVSLQPLHRGDTAGALLASTLAGADARPSARGQPDVAPEIDAICVRATALEPAARHGSARELAQALEHYLDGDRDQARRRELASGHLAAARGILDDPDRQPGARVEALRQLGRAVALDPENGEALDAMAHLLVEAPEVLPPEAEAELERVHTRGRRAAVRTGAVRYLLWSLWVPLAIWMGIRNWPLAGSIIAFMLLSGGTAWWMSRRRDLGDRHTAVLLAFSSITIAFISALFGPFILAPGLAATNCMFFAMHMDRRGRAWIAAASVLAVVLPFAAELAGLIPPAYGFAGGVLQVLPRTSAFPQVATTVTLLVTSVLMVLVPAALAGRMNDSLAAAERRLFLQAWSLSQLVPQRAREAIHWTRRRGGDDVRAPIRSNSER